MIRRNLFILTTLLLCGWLLWGSGQYAAHAAVTLRDFDVTYDAATQSMRIVWETGTEADAAGFYLKRVSGGEAFTSINGPDWDTDLIFVEMENGDLLDFIDARGDAATGALYTAIDADITPGETYSYLLVEEEINGVLILPAPAPITVFTDTPPTPTSQAIGGGDPTSTPTPQPAATNTPAPTNTPPAGSTNTPAPTNTPAAGTATASPTPAAAGTTPAASPTAATNTPTEATATPAALPTQDTGGDSGSEETEGSEDSGSSDAGVDAGRATVAPNATPTEDSTRFDPLTGGAVGDTPATGESGALDGGSTDGGIAVAGENDGGLSSVPPASAQEQGYPVENGNAPATPTPDGYVAPDTSVIGGGDSSGSAPAGSTVIGQNDQLPPPVDTAPAAQGSAPNALLWGIFIAALLVFIGGVIGSILIFTRQRNNNQS